MFAEPVPPVIKRLRPVHWTALDCLIAGLYAPVVWSVFTPRMTAPSLAWLGTALVVGSIAAGRRRPVTAFITLVAAFWLVTLAQAPPRDQTPVTIASVPMVYLLYVVTTTRGGRTAGPVLAVSVATQVATGLWHLVRDDDSVPFVLVFVTTWAIGRVVGQHRRYGRELLRHHARLAEAELERARHAVTEERVRIARELHDVVAHGMSVITVQAGFAKLVIDDRPADARTALEAIETTGRQALTEMRHLLGILREESPDPSSPPDPAPRLADLRRLVERTAQAGVSVELRTTGRPRDVPAGIDLSAYRIVQEALTNVVKHAGTTAAQVVVGYRPDELTIDVTDQGTGGNPRTGRDRDTDAGRHGNRDSGRRAGASAGHGLVGMRERANLYGGRFDAGPLPGGGYRVAVRLPLPAAGEGTA